ncbi:RecX family transcriptional regulator [Candidatus Saccharibacteria bacterium]|nr:RecX family transcriptional regulator [Candidatus Saccharibacteria bacterium]
MDIYKISEELSEEEFFGDREEIREDFELRITDLRQGVKNPDRVNIYVNGKFAFSLDVSQVVDLGVKKDLAISLEQLEEFKKASEFGKLYQRTLEWVLTRPHSERETRDYLYKKIYDKKLDKSYIDRIIEKLESKGYVDDRKFAEYYVENRFLKKGISMRRLQMELTKKGVSRDVISEVLSEGERNEKEEILKVIAKKRSKYDTDEKLISYLLRQGFQYELSRELVRSYGKD